MFYANQKQIVIHREKVIKTSGKKFLCVYEESLKRAFKSLSNSAFKTYIYLLNNRDGYSLEYSPAAISAETGLSLETIRRNFKELEEKRFLIKSNDRNNLYDFYEVHMPNIGIKVERREFVDDETGEIYNLSYRELIDMVGEEEAKYMWEESKNE